LRVERLALRPEQLVEAGQIGSPSNTASITWSVSTGTGTEMPSELRIARCLRNSTSNTMPSIWLSVP
jgi:hypothetical protein